MKKLGFGFVNLLRLDRENLASVDVEAVKRMADRFMESGFTYFDTDPSYHRGSSEITLREAVVKRFPRASYTVTDKLSLFMLQDETQFPGFFQRQLERLGLEEIDYYWLHGLEVLSGRQAEEAHVFDFLRQVKAEGRVKHIGLAFHDKAALLDQILTQHPEMEYVQLQLNYLDWEDPSMESRKCYEVAAKYRKPVVVMEPVKDGCLADIPEAAKDMLRACHPEWSMASWAIRFAASLPYVMMVLSDMDDGYQMEEALSYMKQFKPLGHKELTLLRRVAGIIHASVAIPHTACLSATV